MTVGIASYGALAGSTAATNALQAQVSATNAATTAVGSAVLPPGLDSASAFATGNQIASTQQFGAMIQLGVVELQKRNAVLTANAAENSLNDAASAAATAVAPNTVPL